MSTTAVVLIVESSRGRGEALRAALEEPHHIVEVARLDEARSAAGQFQPSPDLILSDLRGTDGKALALYRRLRADPVLEGTPVLLLVPSEATSGEADGPGGAEPPLPESVGPEDVRRLVGHHLAVEGVSPGPPLVPDAPLPEVVAAVVEARLGDPTFTAEDLAAALDLSRRQLTRRMKEEMEATPAAYIRARRLDRAKGLLAGGLTTVKQVATAVGFASASAFAKAFREHAGVPPSTYAERHAE